MKLHLLYIIVLLVNSALSGESIFSQVIASSRQSKGISHDSSAIDTWATGCRVTRGLVRIDQPGLGYASSGDEAACLGESDNSTVSLGDAGIAVLSFGKVISNIEGPDFAIFENSFDGKFLELAFVEISSDSIRWVRFPSGSLTPTNIQVGTFGTIDPSEIVGLAGNCPALSGTPFDIDDLRDSSGIDLMNVKYIRIIDVVGCVDENWSTRDSGGRVINDPWPTPFPQGGFDLDAVALLRKADVTGGENEKDLLVYPNPARGEVNLSGLPYGQAELRLFDLNGRLRKAAFCDSAQKTLDISGERPGLYYLRISVSGKSMTRKLVIY
ncbi:MAG: T9SS type A sorting domain-containing protein [Bacteroidales bacterium]